MTSPVGIDESRVGRWLDENVAGVTGPYEHELIAGGRSNLTFRVTDARGTTFVLRRPPLGTVLATAHDMAREHRIMAAVGTTPVPVPRTLGLCTDAEVNGAPFYVMSHVAGEVLDSPAKADLLDPARRTAASEHLVDVLADLHAVDIDAVGLGDLARRGGYIERQLKRWSTQWENSKTRELPAIEELAARLTSGVPGQRDETIAHGDYRFGNCIVDTAAGRVTAVLDWELCTLGDPLADLGYLGVFWSDPGAEARRANDPSGVEGFPTYADLVGRYAARTGRDVSDVAYYVAFSGWRLAVITEGVYRRYRDGAMGDDGADPGGFRAMVEVLVDTSLDVLRKGI